LSDIPAEEAEVPEGDTADTKPHAEDAEKQADATDHRGEKTERAAHRKDP